MGKPNNAMLRSILVVLVLVGCKPSSEAPKPAGNLVQPRFSNGQSAPTKEGKLAFKITKLHTGREPTKTAPFHAPGGSWTFLEAHIDGDPAATFVVGMPPVRGSSEGPSFSSLIFAPTTHEGGERVIRHLAKALATKEPPKQEGGVLQPLKMPSAVLGHGISKLDNGYGGVGTWDATKLFCSAEEIEAAELFFNVDLAKKQGEFSEKDTDYNADVVACLAFALRDGLPPPRTPENDPTLALNGLRLELGKRIGGRMQEVALLPNRVLLVDEQPESAALVELDLKTGVTKKLYSTKERLEWGICDETAARCLLKASTPKRARNVFGGDDPARLLVLEGTVVKPLPLPGSGGALSLTRSPFSPDGRFVVASDGYGRRLLAVDRRNGRTVTLSAAERESLEVVAWAKESSGWVAVVTKGDGESQPQVMDWQVERDGLTKPSKRTPPEEISPLSHDGTRRAEFTLDGKLIVTVGGKPRTLTLHRKDARIAGPGCCAWIDNRFLNLRGGFIDTDTMKVTPRADDDDDDRSRVAYIRGTRTALEFRADSTHLATLVAP